ncbi:Leucine-rich repeat extensin-like protein 2 [Sesamum angolense]|uniref:Cell wall hydroxyproline-rich glycoprotein n=1 Tax=Sesamum angolense TaxID=2727404 RepID=A0AAE1VX86_9LAMI|nr:Leucine-rich repeat extensin-like protein 2 [Sesamum angolense]
MRFISETDLEDPVGSPAKGNVPPKTQRAWNMPIFSDPFNFTANWTGPDVCSYGGVFCAASQSNSSVRVVAGIDLNHADIAGYLPDELGLLTDLALFHINSNRFCGVVPESFKKLKLLFELDLSNNRFVGGFPTVVLSLPSLRFLDLRFNDFEGGVPARIFDKDLDALFLNDNRFRFGIPENLGNSPVSVLVLANNNLGGCIPGSIGKMGRTLNELILMNDNLTGCLPPQIGRLRKLTVFDVSFNNLQGPLPAEITRMRSLEQLDVAHNRLTGEVPANICQLPRLHNFTYSYNYFTREAPQCSRFGGGTVMMGGRIVFRIRAIRGLLESARRTLLSRLIVASLSAVAAGVGAGLSPLIGIGRPPGLLHHHHLHQSLPLLLDLTPLLPKPSPPMQHRRRHLLTKSLP